MATKGIVRGIVSNLVTVEVDGEVIKVIGKNAYVQVFESTRGMRVGDTAEFQGHMLEVTLGPGMLSRNYDGLQNDLDKMQGVFLKRGEYTYPLDEEKKWTFKPLALGWVKWTRTLNRTRLWFRSPSKELIPSRALSRKGNILFMIR